MGKLAQIRVPGSYIRIDNNVRSRNQAHRRRPGNFIEAPYSMTDDTSHDVILINSIRPTN